MSKKTNSHDQTNIRCIYIYMVAQMNDIFTSEEFVKAWMT